MAFCSEKLFTKTWDKSKLISEKGESSEFLPGCSVLQLDVGHCKDLGHKYALLIWFKDIDKVLIWFRMVNFGFFLVHTSFPVIL